VTATYELGLTEEQLADLAASFRHAVEVSLRSPADLAVFCDPAYVRRPHVNLISAELSKLHTGELDRLMIRVPPQTGKTRTAAIWTPFWWLAHHPGHRVIIYSYSNTLAVARGRQVRKLVDAHGWRYDLEREYGEGTAADWGLTAGGGVKSAGVGGGLTGSNADFGVIDDPHKNRAEAESRVKREEVWNGYSGDFLSRLAPGAPVVLIMTPWHPDDLSHRVLDNEGRIEEGGRWRVVDLPAFARSNDPLGRAVGEPLTHPKIAEDDIAALRKFWEQRRAATTARDWVSLYMLEPKPMTEALVTEQMMRDRTHLPPPAQPRRAAVAVDPSGGGRDNAGVVGGWLGDDRRAYVTHDRSVHGPSETWGRAAVLLAAEIDADVIVYEKNFGGDQAEFVIKKSWEACKREAAARRDTGRAPEPFDNVFLTRLPPRVVGVTARKNKLLRAEPIAQQINDDQVRFAAHMPELTTQWTSWRPTDKESPGNLDACVYLAYELLPVDNGPSQLEVPPATPIPGMSPSPAAGFLPGAGLPGGIDVVPALGDLQRRRRR